MIPRVDIESIPYLITFSMIFIYIYLLKVYTVRKRIIKRIFLIITSISMAVPFIYSTFQSIEFNLIYSYNFLYSHSTATFYERIFNLFYSMSGDTFLLFSAFFLLALRYRVRHQLYRGSIRESLNGYLLSIASLTILYIFYPPFEIYEDITALDGRGLYPIWTLPYPFLTVVAYYLGSSLVLMGASLYLYLWRESIPGLSEFARKSLFIGSAILTIVLFIRFLYSNIVFGRERFINFTTFDIALIIVLVSTLLFYEISYIAETRIIGSMAVSSYLTVFSVLTSVVALRPETFLPLNNVLNTGEYIFLFLISSILLSLVISREIFRRSFFPWFSEDIEFLARGGSSIVFFSLLFSMMISLFNLSIYYTFGDQPVRVSTDFIVSILFYLSTFTFMSLAGELVGRRSLNINYVILTVFGIYAVIGGGYNYNLWFIRDYIYVYPLLAVPLAGYLIYKYRKFPLTRLLLLFIFFHLLASQIWFGGGPIKTIDTGGSIEFKGYTLSNPLFNISISDIEVYSDVSSNSTSPYYTLEYVVFDGGLRLDRYIFDSFDLRFSTGYIGWDLISYREYIIGLVAGSSESVSIYIADVYWSPLSYLVLPIILVIAMYIGGRFKYY